MSKYTPERLKLMATTALAAKENGDERWLILVLSLGVAMGMPADEVERRIRELAA